MKLKGRTLAPPASAILVIPRHDEEDLVFYADVVMDFKPFEEKYPFPNPPIVTERGKKPYKDTDDEEFQQKILKYSEARTNWMILTSLAATPDLEWDTVDMDQPDTWAGFQDELDASLAPFEVEELIRHVLETNSISDSRKQEALERFTLSQEQAQAHSSSRREERASTVSGEPAKDSE